MIDTDKVIADVKLALDELEKDEQHGNRVVAAISNRLHDDAKFPALVIACYRQMLENGMTPTTVALTICMGIMLAQGVAPFTDKPKQDLIPNPPAGYRVN